MKVAVIGGAGYIGAHVVRLLAAEGAELIVVDDLSTSTRERIGEHELVELDVAGPDAVETLTKLFEKRGIESVIHFAARKQVGESVARPMWYYQQNVGGLTNVLTAMDAAGVDKIIFSSSAATYGEPPVDVVTEDTVKNPINPYGETKLIGEWMMADCARAWGLNWIGLRYFNAAGAGWPELGDQAIMNLIPMVFDRLQRGEAPRLFGDDYPTPDGSCVRDYIHVLDLARAHVLALKRLYAGNDLDHRVFNVATGTGSSVKAVLAEIGRASGLDTTPVVDARRPGDPPTLIASPERIRTDLGFEAEYGLRDIVESAWAAWQHR